MRTDTNRLEQRRAALRWWRCDPGWRALLDEWARLNDLRRADSSAFGHATLRDGRCHDRLSDHPSAHDLYPGRDHDTCFRRARRAAAIVTEPYGSGGDRGLFDFFSGMGLVVHLPPNPVAGFW